MQRIALSVFILTLFGCSKHTVQFLNTPCLIPYKRFDFELCEHFIVLVDKTIYTVPKGLQTDLASIPRPLWALFPPQDTFTIGASILHDYMYRFEIPVTRKQADDIFYHGLIAGGTRQLTALKYYTGVRLFGWRCFRK